MSSEERDSQLSAMFDDELPVAECELLTRRLMRDDALKTSWSHYALVGAALRNDPFAFRVLHRDVAFRVRLELDGEPQLDAPAVHEPRRGGNWFKAAFGAAIAASVAAASILMLRGQSPEAPTIAAARAPATTAPVLLAEAAKPASTRSADPAPSYVVPPATDQGGPRTSVQLANYVVAHSEYAAPVVRLSRLSSFMASDIDADDADDAAAEAVSIDAR